jgi:hypothetical protein
VASCCTTGPPLCSPPSSWSVFMSSGRCATPFHW